MFFVNTRNKTKKSQNTRDIKKTQKTIKIMVNLIERDSSKRREACKYELSRLVLKSIIINRSLGEQERFRAAIKLSGLPRNSSKTRLRNRCVSTGRGRAVYRFCKLSRIKLRDLVGAGKLPGVTKSSW